MSLLKGSSVHLVSPQMTRFILNFNRCYFCFVLASEEETQIRDAFDTIMAETMVAGKPCITISERTTQADYIYIQPTGG